MSTASGCGSHGHVDAGSAIAHFDSGRRALDRSFARLDAAAENDPRATRSAAVSHLSSRRLPEHFAAVYEFCLTAGASDRSELRSLLRSSRVTDRLLAAAALARLRDRTAIPPLIDALDSSAPVEYWAPAFPAWRFARLVLLERTGRDLGLRRASTARAGRAAAVRWRRWWQASSGSFRFPKGVVAP